MKHTTPWLGIGVLLAATAVAASPGPGVDDGFGREGKDRTAKDALEGKAPPALQVQGWMNTGEGGLALSDLKGKVVVLDFWGTW